MLELTSNMLYLCSWCKHGFGYAHPKGNFCVQCGVSLTNFQPPVETGIMDQRGRYIMAGDRIHVVIERVSERGEFTDRTDDFIGHVEWKNGAFYLYATPYVRDLLSKYMGSHWTKKKFEVVDENTRQTL